jgi:16S rRNA A1518/A1519 N6-dimethyltransferase RsmA/KsgA/DIM1 with predicted DNA glycosylase/AP lyase activity
MMQRMVTDREIATHADPSLDQHFLVSDEKLSKLIDAAQISPTDNVVEIGAGIGTVARALPPGTSLTVIEIDNRLTKFLKENAPHARILQGDALKLVQEIPCDVLISNLPTRVTESLITLLPRLSFRTAVLAVAESTDLNQLSPAFTWSDVTRITGNDFIPPQSSVSRIIKISRKDAV